MPNINEISLGILCRTMSAGSRITISVQRKIPDGVKIFACNHPTNIDLVYCYELMDYPIALVMKWGLDIPIIGPLMRKCGFIPVKKDGRAAYSLALNALLSGRNIYICPEGGLSGPGTHAKTGAARLAIQTGYPIIPVGIKHEGKIYHIPIGSGKIVKYMPFGKTKITFGIPMESRLAFGNSKRARWLTDRLMGIIRGLSL